METADTAPPPPQAASLRWHGRRPDSCRSPGDSAGSWERQRGGRAGRRGGGQIPLVTTRGNWFPKSFGSHLLPPEGHPGRSPPAPPFEGSLDLSLQTRGSAGIQTRDTVTVKNTWGLPPPGRPGSCPSPSCCPILPCYSPLSVTRPPFPGPCGTFILALSVNVLVQGHSPWPSDYGS